MQNCWVMQNMFGVKACWAEIQPAPNRPSHGRLLAMQSLSLVFSSPKAAICLPSPTPNKMSVPACQGGDTFFKNFLIGQAYLLCINEISSSVFSENSHQEYCHMSQGSFFLLIIKCANRQQEFFCVIQCSLFILPDRKQPASCYIQFCSSPQPRYYNLDFYSMDIYLFSIYVFSSILIVF